MANNRMYLMHESGYHVYLGQRLGSDYHNTPEDIKNRIERLFNTAYKEGYQDIDGFSIRFENDESTIFNSDKLITKEGRNNGTKEKESTRSIRGAG